MNSELRKASEAWISKRFWHHGCPRSTEERSGMSLINAPTNNCGDLSILILPMSEDMEVIDKSRVREL